MRRWMILTAAVAMVALTLVPILVIGRLRRTTSVRPRVHPIMDMDNQPKYQAQQASGLFADGRAMRLPVPGTMARGELGENQHLHSGKIDGEWATTFPLAVTGALMQRGQERFNIFCSPCHGLDGSGRGMVALRAEALGEPAWVKPRSFHDQEVSRRPVGYIFNTIGQGMATMPAYGPQIRVTDRWAIVAYVRALQRSRDARLEDVPEELRDSLE